MTSADRYAAPPVPLLSHPLPLARCEIDRDAARRAEPALVEALRRQPGTWVVVVSLGDVAIQVNPPRLHLIPARDVQVSGPSEWFYLGRDGERSFLALAVTGSELAALADGPPNRAAGSTQAFTPDTSMRPLRECGHLLTDADAGLATTAVALAQWRSRHQFCSQCGQATDLIDAGWTSRCTRGHLGYPRTDPAVIMALHDGAGRLLLARSSAWPQSRRSVLAGFVEAGEDPDHALRREVAEEVGISVGSLQYAGSQPWPFPGSLMLGYHAWVADPAATSPRPDGEEITTARWYTREELRKDLTDGEIVLPMRTSIARALIESWYGGELP